MTIGVYVRVSTEEQAEKGISLDNQINRGKQLALKMGWDSKVYKDAGMSGTIPFKERPGLNAMMIDIGSKKIGAVFVIDTDRLSRGGIIHTTLIKDFFREHQIRLFDLNSEIDLNDINQSLLSDMKDLLANFEIKKTGGRIRTVLEANVAKGKVGGGALLPFGYTKDLNKMLVIDEDEKDVVTYVFNLALQGKGTKMIATILNSQGVLTKRGRVTTGKGMMVKGKKKETFLWRDSVIYNMLTNTIYMGQRLYKENYYNCPAIVSEASFSLVRKNLSTRNQFKDTTNKYDYLLKGLIQCGFCKGRFYGHKRANGNDNTYICNSQRYSGEWCGNKGINIDYLNKLVIDNILNLEDTTSRSFTEMAKDERMSVQLSDFNNFTEKIKDIDDRISNLIGMVELGGADPKVFKKRLQELNREKNSYQNLLEDIKKNIGVFEHEKNIKGFVRDTVSSFKKLKSLEEKKLAIQNIVDRITLRWNKDKSEHMIGIFYRLDSINLYMMSNEVTVNRRPNNWIGKVVSEKVYLSNAINFMGYEEGEEVALIRYDAPYSKTDLTGKTGIKRQNGESVIWSKGKNYIRLTNGNECEIFTKNGIQYILENGLEREIQFKSY